MFLESILQAFQGVWAHKLRSLLTMLGIIIGIASIITIVSTIKGTNEQIKENLIGSGNNGVVVRLCQDGYAYDMQYSAPPEGVIPITEETRQELCEIDHVENVSLYNYRSYPDGVYYCNTAFSGTLLGIDEYYFEAAGYTLQHGRPFTQDDFDECRKVCILDSTAVSTLFSGSDPLGKTIEISGEPFIVIGVAEQENTSEPTVETLQDYYSYAQTGGGTIFLPNRVWGAIYRFDEPQYVLLEADSTDNMTDIGQTAETMLTSSQVLDSDSDLSYKSEDLMEQASQLQQLSASSNNQLIWIAGISLLVGGIGVMNIMLVTVTERTQEIGLKKAIGARRRRILVQFLTEAAVLTSCGGIIGVIAGIIMARLISSIMGTPTSLSLPAILIAVAFSVVIGIVFGLLPAVKASKLNPIQALRRD